MSRRSSLFGAGGAPGSLKERITGAAGASSLATGLKARQAKVDLHNLMGDIGSKKLPRLLNLRKEGEDGFGDVEIDFTARGKMEPKPTPKRENDFNYWRNMMNAADRKAVNAILEQVNDLKGQAESLAEELRALGDAEQEKLDNMPEGLRGGEAGLSMEGSMESLYEAADALDSGNLEEASEALECV